MRTQTGQYAYSNGYQDCLDDIKNIINQAYDEEDIAYPEDMRQAFVDIQTWVEVNSR